MRLEHISRGSRLRLSQSVFVLASVIGLTACASLSGIEPQATLRDAPSLGLPANQSEQLAIDTQWWRAFGDEQLKQFFNCLLT